MLNLDRGKKISPFTIPQLLGNTASGMIAIELGAMGAPTRRHAHVNAPSTISSGALSGPNYGVASACAAGSHSVHTGNGSAAAAARSCPGHAMRVVKASAAPSQPNMFAKLVHAGSHAMGTAQPLVQMSIGVAHWI